MKIFKKCIIFPEFLKFYKVFETIRKTLAPKGTQAQRLRADYTSYMPRFLIVLSNFLVM